MPVNYPQPAAGYQKNAMRIIPKASPPNVFIGGPAEFRLDSRLEHAGMTIFGEEIRSTQQAVEN
jgi:hypothetical protein